MADTELSRIKMLIADDEPISRKLLQKLLADSFDADILVACDGHEAWQLILSEDIHIIIADWMMPGMNGVELCSKLRQTHFDHYVYCILLTARDEQKDVLEGLQAGADDYIRKPFDPQELRLRINAGLRIIRLEEELDRKNEQLVDLNRKLDELARIDPVMNIGNRHSFYGAIERLHDQWIRYDKKYGLLICDVDHFKLYNDTQGHQAGDRVLHLIAQAIKENIRCSDEVFRYGGEEIVVLLAEQAFAGAITAAQRLCKKIASLGIYHPQGINNVVTISIGAAACDSEQTKCSWNDVLEMADQALYKAKARGRNSCYPLASEAETA